MVNNICLVKDKYYNQVSGKVVLEETVEPNIYMRVELNHTVGSLYHFFCEESAKKREQSRIKFLEVDNFPDGILIKFNNDKAEVSICELKRTPLNKLTQLSRQLYAGYVHSKLLLKLLDIDESGISYSYKVFLINDDRSKEVEYNEIPHVAKKITPGQAVTNPADYNLWTDNKVKFVEQSYQQIFTVEKHKLQELVPLNDYYYDLEL